MHKEKVPVSNKNLNIRNRRIFVGLLADRSICVPPYDRTTATQYDRLLEFGIILSSLCCCCSLVLTFVCDNVHHVTIVNWLSKLNRYECLLNQ